MARGLIQRGWGGGGGRAFPARGRGSPLERSVESPEPSTSGLPYGLVFIPRGREIRHTSLSSLRLRSWLFRLKSELVLLRSWVSASLPSSQKQGSRL